MVKNFPSVINRIEQGIWSYDLLKNEFTLLNQAMILLLKLSAEEILSPDSWLPYVHPDDEVAVKTSLLSYKHEMYCTYRYQRPGHSTQWFSEHRIVVRDKEEKIVCIEGVLTDITAQKAGEEMHAKALHEKNLELETANEELTAMNEELQAANEEMYAANEQLSLANETIKAQADIIAQQSEEKINRILHSLNDVVWSVELPTNEHAYVSPAVEKIYGISIKEVIENPFFWREALHPDDIAMKDAKLAEAFAVGYSEYTYRIIRADNTICWLYDRVRVIHDADNTPVRIDGISTDVTELVETQKTLEQREAQLKNAQRIAKMGSWESDLLNNKLYWSDEIYHIFGIEKQSETTLDTFLAAVYPADHEKLMAARQEAMAGIKPYHVEHRIVLPNGGIKEVREIGEVIFNEEGTPVWFSGTVQDITEYKKIQGKLLETTERFTLATKSAEIGIWEWNIHDNILIWDEITCGIFGVNKEEFSGSLDTWISFLHPDSISYAQQQVEKALRGEEDYNAELKVITVNKAIKYIKTYAKVLFGENQKPERMIGAMWNITWQKYAEEELIRYSERLDTVIGSITDGFFIIDREWNFIRANQAFEKINNLSEEKLIGKNIWDLFPNLRHTQIYTEYHRAMDTGASASFEINSENQWYYVSAYPSKEGLAVYFRNITKEKEIQQQILFSQKNLDALINNTTDFIWSIDKDMKFVSVNDAYKAITAILGGRTEIKTGDPAISETFDAQMVSRFKNYYARAFAGERFSIEERIVLPGREAQYIEVSFNPMYNENREVIGVGCFGRNVTERKKAEEEKSLLIQRLIEQNKYLEEFAFITSHNLRAPVARIIGLTTIFNQEDMHDPLNLKLIQNLEKSAYLLDDVIKDIARVLDMRKQEDEVREEVYLDTIFLEIRELLAQEIEKTGAEIQIDFSEGLQLYTIKSYIRNIMLNLISNAIKYKKIEQSPRIFVKSYKKGNYFCISIQDNGLGIDLDKYGSQIFTLYKRFHSHTEGKGMGMYLVKSQVDALNGEIQIDSKVNEGTTVKVCLKNEVLKKSQ